MVLLVLFTTTSTFDVHATPKCTNKYAAFSILVLWQVVVILQKMERAVALRLESLSVAGMTWDQWDLRMHILSPLPQSLGCRISELSFYLVYINPNTFMGGDGEGAKKKILPKEEGRVEKESARSPPGLKPRTFRVLGEGP